MDFTSKYTNNNEEKILLRKIYDLVHRSEKTFTVLYSHFLTPAEQTLIKDVDEFRGYVTFEGGYEDAERRVCRIQTAEYEQDDGAGFIMYEITVTALDPEISHRDVLGALMGLGIKREMLGDIIMKEKGALFFCDNSVAEYIRINLEKIGRYRVEISEGNLSNIPTPETECKTINISSPRLDSICAECFGISRTKAAEAIRRGLVSIDWQVCDNVSRELKGGEKISLRGKGKVKYNGITGTSKKGRMFAGIQKYI